MFSSAIWFDGWAPRVRLRPLPEGDPPVHPATTWLLTTGWRKHGPLDPAAAPS